PAEPVKIADPIGALEVGEHQDVDELGRGAGPRASRHSRSRRSSSSGRVEARRALNGDARPRLLPVRADLDDLTATERVELVSDALVASWSSHEQARRLAAGEVLQHVVAPAAVGGLGGAPLACGQVVIAQAAVDDVRPLAAVDPVVAAPPVDDLRAVHALDLVALGCP